MIEWISVKDDLPKVNEEVLVWVTGGGRAGFIRGTRAEGQWFLGSSWDDGLLLHEQVTHWSRVNAPKRKRRAPGRKV